MQQLGWIYPSIGSLSLSFVISVAAAQAQIIPDHTLGSENSVVVPQLVIQGVPSDRIDGGALRGSNLFHSFQEFNIREGQGAYFSNPIGVDHILSRVTGGNPSAILGRLGVLGDAHLFLLNPNGVLFGANASLDIPGSLTVTTANAIQLGQSDQFSATHPQQSSLIAVAPGALFLNALSNATIANQGNLTTGQSLRFVAGKLDLTGQVQAGKDLTLQATEVQVQDSPTKPTIVLAGGQLLIQGDRTLQLSMLNHPDSGVYAIGDLTLRSGNTIGGDAHYGSGGNFRVEKLDGSLGSLFSPNDPIIFASGDVTFDSYTGASLHILAGGSVTIGDVTITEPDVTGNAINPTTTPDLANITLSNGTALQIDGTTQATLDIRAGTTAVGAPAILGTNFTNLSPPPNLTNPATSANITVNSITLNQPGLILLTNQYQPNSSLASANITIGAINAGSTTSVAPGNGSPVFVDTRGSFNLNGLLDTSSFAGNGGDVTVLAAGDITLDGAIDTSDQFSGAGNAGNITLSANGNLTLTVNANLFSSGLLGGEILLNSGADTSIASSIITESTTPVPGTTGGNLDITARSLFANNATLSASSFFSQANSGNVTIQASEVVNLDASSITTIPITDATTAGNGGDIHIIAQVINLTNNSTLNSGTPNQGKAGDIHLRATTSITLDNTSSIVSRVFDGATNDGGTIEITTGFLQLDNFSSLQTETSGQGDAGNIVITANHVDLRNGAFITSEVGSTAIGQGGNVQIDTHSLSVTQHAEISANTSGQGNAGNIQVNAADGFVILSDASSQISTQTNSDTGKGGTIAIDAQTVQISNHAKLDASTTAGNEGGDILVTADTIDLSSGGRLQTTTSGSGQAGTIQTIADDRLTVSGSGSGLFADSTATASGDGGSIFVEAPTVEILDRAGIAVNNLGQGNGGTIVIDAGNVTLDQQAFLSAATASGRGGNIVLNVDDLLQLRRNSLISAEAGNAGDGGNVTIDAAFVVAFLEENSDISANAFQGRGGNIDITTQGLFGFVQLDRNTPLSDITASSAFGLNGVVQINTPDVDVQSSVTELSGNFANPDQVVAGSCLARQSASRGSFTVTGTGGLARTPYDPQTSSRYSVTTVQPLPEEKTTPNSSTQSSITQPLSPGWRLGDPIREAQGVAITKNGQKLLDTTTQLATIASAEEIICQDTISNPE